MRIRARAIFFYRHKPAVNQSWLYLSVQSDAELELTGIRTNIVHEDLLPRLHLAFSYSPPYVAFSSPSFSFIILIPVHSLYLVSPQVFHFFLFYLTLSVLLNASLSLSLSLSVSLSLSFSHVPSFCLSLSNCSNSYSLLLSLPLSIVFSPNIVPSLSPTLHFNTSSSVLFLTITITFFLLAHMLYSQHIGLYFRLLKLCLAYAEDSWPSGSRPFWFLRCPCLNPPLHADYTSFCCYPLTVKLLSLLLYCHFLFLLTLLILPFPSSK